MSVKRLINFIKLFLDVRWKILFLVIKINYLVKVYKKRKLIFLIFVLQKRYYIIKWELKIIKKNNFLSFYFLVI